MTVLQSKPVMPQLLQHHGENGNGNGSGGGDFGAATTTPALNHNPNQTPHPNQQHQQQQPHVGEDEAWSLDVQLDGEELMLAFRTIDVDGDGRISEADALASLQLLNLVDAQADDDAASGVIAATRGVCSDFAEFCAQYYAVHPVCGQCAEAAFDQMDSDPKDGRISLAEAEAFLEPFEKSAFHCDAKALLQSAVAGFASPTSACYESGGAIEDVTLDIHQFRSMLGSKFVEMAFEPKLATEIVRRMRR